MGLLLIILKIVLGIIIFNLVCVAIILLADFIEWSMDKIDKFDNKLKGYDKE